MPVDKDGYCDCGVYGTLVPSVGDTCYECGELYIPPVVPTPTLKVECPHCRNEIEVTVNVSIKD